jgi:hypothetical protein
MNISEAKEFQIVYQAICSRKRAFIRTGIVVCKLEFGRKIPDFYVLSLDTRDDNFWRSNTSKNFQDIERWNPTKKKAIDRAISLFTDELNKKAEQEQEGVNNLNDLWNLVVHDE